MAKKSVKGKSTSKHVEAAAEEAVSEMFMDAEEETHEPAFEDDGVSLSFSQAEASTDVFEEGFKKAVSVKDSPRYHIKKNSQFLTVKDYPYSWERLQAEYGPGYYQVTCKARSTGRILKMQTEMVGDPNEGKAQTDEVESKTPTDSNLAVLGWLQQASERADQRAQELAKGQESSLATVMQAVMTAQQESSKIMMQMMMEQSKQTQNLLLTMMQANQAPKNDPIVTLLTTLLTQKKDDGGFTTATVMKMIQDAETRAETRATKNYEMIEKKANDLAEIKAEAMAGGEGEGEESLSKTLLKTFIPVLPQIMAGANQAQGQIPGQFQAQNNPALNQGFVEEGPVRPMIPAARPQRPPAPQPQAAKPPVARPVVVPAQEMVLNDRQKDIIFDAVASDIAGAMIQQVPASEASEAILKKLEIEGITRQTVARGFTVEDFYGYADKFIPPESLAAAKTWLKEFHESIQKSSAAKPAAPAPTNNGSSAKGSATGEPRTVSAKRGAPVRAAGAQSPQPTKTV